MRIRYVFPLILQFLIWVPTRLILVVFGRLRIYGRERTKGVRGGVIFAVNHSSELDPILIPASWGVVSRFAPAFYVSRESTFYNTSGWRQSIYGGKFFASWGAYPAYVGQKEYPKILRHHMDILGHGKSLIVFPEGKKTLDGNIAEGKGGVAFLAHACNVPIVPVAMRGHFQMRLSDFFLRRRTISIMYGAPILPAELALGENPQYDDYKRASQLVMDRIRTLYGELAHDAHSRGDEPLPQTPPAPHEILIPQKVLTPAPARVCTSRNGRQQKRPRKTLTA